MAVTSNVFPLRLNGLKEAKCPRLRSIFSTHRCQNTSSGVAQVKSREERISKLDRGTEQQIRGSWTSSTLHTTRSHSRSQGCTDACQFFRFKAKTSKRCSSPLCGGSSTFALIIQKKKNSGVSPQLTLPVVVIAEKFQLGRALSSSLCLIEMVQEEKQTWWRR